MQLESRVVGLPPPAAALWTPPYGGTQRGYAHMHTFAHICMYTIYKPPYIRMPPRTSRVAAKCRKLAPSRSTGCVRTAAMASPARRSAPGMGTGWQAGRLGLQAGRLGLQARDTWGCRRAVWCGAVRCGAVWSAPIIEKSGTPLTRHSAVGEARQWALAM